MKTSIATISQLTAADIYRVDAMDSILAIVTTEAEKQIDDVNTGVGRKSIISLAAKISRTKTHLDRVGKDLVTEWKHNAKLVDQDRKKARDTLDALRDKIRAPVTEWENKEKDRIKALEDRIAGIHEIMQSSMFQEEPIGLLPTIKDRLMESNSQLHQLQQIVIDESFQEFYEEAQTAKADEITNLESHIVYLAELEKEEKAQTVEVARQQQEREKQIAENARQDEKRKAAIELDRAQQEKIELIKSLEKQQIESKNFLDAQLAAAQAQAEAEAQRIKEEQARKESEKKEAARLREANVENQRKCNNEAFTAFMDGGLEAVPSKLAVELIAKKKIPHTVINY